MKLKLGASSFYYLLWQGRYNTFPFDLFVEKRDVNLHILLIKDQWMLEKSWNDLKNNWVTCTELFKVKAFTNFWQI